MSAHGLRRTRALLPALGGSERFRGSADPRITVSAGAAGPHHLGKDRIALVPSLSVDTLLALAVGRGTPPYLVPAVRVTTVTGPGRNEIMDDETYQRLRSLDTTTVVEQFLDAKTNTANSREAYRKDLNAYLNWHRSNASGGHPLAVGVSELNNYIRFIDAQPGWGEKYKGRRYGTLGRFFDFIAKQQSIANPMSSAAILPNPGSERPRHEPVETIPLPDFARLVRSSFNDGPPEDALVIGLLGMVGLRREEVHRANVNDVRLGADPPNIVVPTRSVGRMCYLPRPLAALCEEVVGDRTSGPLLTTPTGKRLGAGSLNTTVDRQARLAGVSNVTPTTLRSTAGALAARQGASFESMREMLGIQTRSASMYMAHSHSALPGPLLVWEWLEHRRVGNQLLQQVGNLLREESILPAAPTMLAGAALEIHLRDACQSRGLALGEHGSIDRFKGLLISKGHLDPNPWGPRIDRWRELRNAAAHGTREITLDEARTMASEVRDFVTSGPFAEEA